MPPIDLPVIWAGLIAFAVLAYVVLDGFDLGLGIIFPLLDSERDRDTAVNSVAPVWDGNETWLVLGGGGLLAAFPLAYAVVLPASSWFSLRFGRKRFLLFCIFLFTVSSVSPKYCRRSECPMITCVTPQASNWGAEVSPVNAPSSFQ